MKKIILKKAILSEKAYKQIESGIYSFIVDKKTSKNDIKKSIEAQFATKVLKVRIQSVPKKTKRVTGTRNTTQVGGGKKAIVYLEKGQTIAMLAPKTEGKSKAPKTSKEKNEKKEEKTSGEKPKGKGILSKIRKPKDKEQEK